MDGLEATRQLRERERNTTAHQPVVAMTALVMKGDREKCMAAGMDGYLTKPIRPQELDEVLERYMASVAPVEVLSPEVSEAPRESLCVQELLERVDGDRGFVSELLDLLRGDYPGQIEVIRRAIAKGDCAALQEGSHALKGALGNLAAPLASGIAGELESMGRSGDMSRAGTRVKALEQEIGRVVVQLEELCMEAVQ
jgi:two-component system sensor histidine kinase/response regulator